jgi:hypothetical protein
MSQFDVHRARELLARAVREYQPASDIADLVWLRREAHRAAEGKVTNIQTRRASGKSPG